MPPSNSRTSPFAVMLHSLPPIPTQFPQRQDPCPQGSPRLVPHHWALGGTEDQGSSPGRAVDQLCDRVGLSFFRCKMRGLDHKMFPEGLCFCYIRLTNYCCKQGMSLGQQPSLHYAFTSSSFTPPHTPLSKTQPQLYLLQEAP